MNTHYLIVGSSHAALAALHAIRLHDVERSLVVVSRDDAPPYSPTVLPYVVSGRSDPARVHLKDTRYFEAQRVDYLRGAAVTAIDPAAGIARLANGAELGFEKALIATGARPVVPPVEGLASVPYHVLRTLDDAVRLRAAIGSARRAVVLGGGLIGMHAAENLAKAGAEVTIVEMQPRVLAGYFDAEAAGIISGAFERHGVRVLTGARAVRATPRGQACAIELADGTGLDADLLLVATGVAPVLDLLAGSGVQTDRGVLVDDHMRSSVNNVWAAGDVAQARGFFGSDRVLNGILPDAVEQGRIAGMAMAEDPALPEYPGGVPINTYVFFGQHALSVGVDPDDASDVLRRVDAAAGRYFKLVLRENRLLGAFGVNVNFDPGIMWELILRRTDLSTAREALTANPQDAARVLMSRTWR